MFKKLREAVILKWWFLVCLISLGIVASGVAGIFQLAYEADATKISFGIFGLFVILTGWTGLLTYRATKDLTKKEYERIVRQNGLGHFISDILFYLGMTGTVFGFIMMLRQSFENIVAGNTASMQAALTQMGSGMSTALFTTAAGLVCSILLKVQVYNLDYFLEELEPKNCGENCSCKDSGVQMNDTEK
jgi:hypothetical protein